MPNPGTVGGTLFDNTMLAGAPDTFGGGGMSVPLFEEGNIFRGVYGVAAALTPASLGADVVVAVYSIPAGSFDVAGRGITVTAEGTFAANGNNKRQKLWFAPTTAIVGQAIVGGSLITDGGLVTTNGGGWFLAGNVFKRGLSGSNTQLITSAGAINGAVHAGISGPLDATAVENAAILVAVTINNTTNLADSGLSFFEINAMN